MGRLWSCCIWLAEELVSKVAAFGVTKIVTSVTERAKFKFFTVGPYDYITSVRIEKGKQWDPGGYLSTSIASMVTIQAVRFYEQILQPRGQDVFEGVGNDRIMELI